MRMAMIAMHAQSDVSQHLERQRNHFLLSSLILDLILKEPEHFLDHQTDTDRAAQRFGERQEVGDGGGAAGCGERAGRATVTYAPLLRWGCDQDCLRMFDEGEIEGHRLNLLEMEKSEREALVLGVLHSCSFSDDRNAKGKVRRRNAYAYQFGGRRVCVSVHFATFTALGRKSSGTFVSTWKRTGRFREFMATMGGNHTMH